MSIFVYLFCLLFLGCTSNKKDIIGEEKDPICKYTITGDPDISYDLIYDSSRLILKTSIEVDDPSISFYIHNGIHGRIDGYNKDYYGYSFRFVGKEDTCFVYDLPKDTFPTIRDLNYMVITGHGLGIDIKYKSRIESPTITIIPKAYLTEELIRRCKENKLYPPDDVLTFAQIEAYERFGHSYTIYPNIGQYLLEEKPDPTPRDSNGVRLVYLTELENNECYFHFDSTCYRIDSRKFYIKNFAEVDSLYSIQKSLGYSIYKCGHCIYDADLDSEREIIKQFKAKFQAK